MEGNEGWWEAGEGGGAKHRPSHLARSARSEKWKIGGHRKELEDQTCVSAQKHIVCIGFFIPVTQVFTKFLELYKWERRSWTVLITNLTKKIPLPFWQIWIKKKKKSLLSVFRVLMLHKQSSSSFIAETKQESNCCKLPGGPVMTEPSSSFLSTGVHFHVNFVKQ